jgi:hypothetical protein
VKLPKNIENKDDTVLNKLSLDEKLDSEHLNIAKISCVLATTWLKLREDSFLELRFEVIDALVNTVNFQFVNLKFFLVVGSTENWVHDVNFCLYSSL